MKKTIFYHDTDCGGVVYYGNYMKFFEEARTLFMAEKGYSVPKLMEKGLFFVVARQETEYKYPVRYADVIDVSTKVLEVSDIKIVFENIITNQNGKLCTKGKTTLVCVTQEGVPTSMGKEVKEAMGL
ncbi:MAG: acyl-CoA thioesterase [Elusimicrobiaceae bacterium]|nr:acyl-CoA thioesterase [Elusimicrobiaceae bacterium]MBR2504706.1 acyl-CoA thioesterase [Elusimicrobiaceae bacterium]MBR3603813.1 acyl-CoA thioesterase [Elusimicrobiaceae bacterium]